jgi:hypothetical protein
MSIAPNARFVQQMLATADALRQVRHQLAFLVHAGDPLAAANGPEISTILTDGLNTAGALEKLASRVGKAK